MKHVHRKMTNSRRYGIFPLRHDGTSSHQSVQLDIRNSSIRRIDHHFRIGLVGRLSNGTRATIVGSLEGYVFFSIEGQNGVSFWSSCKSFEDYEAKMTFSDMTRTKIVKPPEKSTSAISNSTFSHLWQVIVASNKDDRSLRLLTVLMKPSIR